MFNNWLATDLDGTFLPLDDVAENLADLACLKSVLSSAKLGLTFVTGRHLSSVLNAISQHALPLPAWIICDVGSSIYRLEGEKPVLVPEYEVCLNSIKLDWSIDRVEAALDSVDGLQKQEAEKQSASKLSYYADAKQIERIEEEIQQILLHGQIPWGIICSVDPFNGDGLVDLLPVGVNKAFAIQWWAEHVDVPTESLIFAGDSGNDLAAFEHGYRTIVVGNTQRAIANRVFWTHENRGTGRQLFLANKKATSGVVEGLRWFEAIPENPPTEKVSLGWCHKAINKSHFAVWAPKCSSVELKFSTKDGVEATTRLSSADGQIFQGTVSAGPETNYQLVLDNQHVRPDPRSELQLGDVHGPSVSVNHRYAWTDSDWAGIAKKDLVIYELHVGTFTSEGTYDAIVEHLDGLLELGITAIELMPVADCPGRWNWGYDGVHLFALTKNYGSPAQLKRIIDVCHQKGLAVILDVVYNHLGPEGNYLSDFGPYFTKRHGTPWGDALNYDGHDSQEVRRLMVDNALYWLRDFHFDGLRLDAIHFMFDDSEYSITQEICDAVGEFQNEVGREIHLIGEANIFDGQLIDSNSEHSYGAIWADCLMHSVYSHGVPEVSLAHRKYCGLEDVHETLTHGYLYTGPVLKRASRSEESKENAIQINTSQLSSLIMALQTHDSVGNHPHGKRLAHLTNVDFQMAAASLFLLYPALPMIFMGEEFSATSPFCFFADFLDKGLRRAVDRGRQQEYPNHQWKGAIAPSDPAAFETSKLATPTIEGLRVRAWYRDLLQLRKRAISEGWLDGERLTIQFDAQQHSFELSYPCQDGRLRIVCQLISPQDESKVGTDFHLIEAKGTVLLDSWDTDCRPTGSSRTLISHG